MSVVVAILVLCVLLAWGIAAWVRHRADTLRLVQMPNHRSAHVQPTPNGGGLGIVVAGTLAGIYLASRTGWMLGGVVLALGAVLAVVGLRDDIKHIAARLRLGIQVVVCAFFLVALDDLPGVTFSAGLEFTVPAWVFSGLLLFAGVWWVNLFNFMDGIDGLAGAQAVFMLVAGAILAAMGNPDAVASSLWTLMLSVVAATVGFLLMNWPPARIFMGDTGSTWLGFMIFALAMLTVQTGWMNYGAWLVLGAVFVSDATITLLTRMLRGERWHEAHNQHAYQRLARQWQGDRKAGHRTVTLLITAVNLLWLAPIAWACLRWPQWTTVLVILAYAPMLVGLLAFRSKPPKRE